MGYLDGINQYMEGGYAHRVSVGRCAERKNSPLKMFIIFLDTCLLVLLWRIKQILTDIRNKYGMEYLKVLT
jgi:intein-encoded DNA endonuclease-like protein